MARAARAADDHDDNDHDDDDHDDEDHHENNEHDDHDDAHNHGNDDDHDHDDDHDDDDHDSYGARSGSGHLPLSICFQFFHLFRICFFLFLIIYSDDETRITFSSYQHLSLVSRSRHTSLNLLTTGDVP